MYYLLHSMEFIPAFCTVQGLSLTSDIIVLCSWHLLWPPYRAQQYKSHIQALQVGVQLYWCFCRCSHPVKDQDHFGHDFWQGNWTLEQGRVADAGKTFGSREQAIQELYWDELSQHSISASDFVQCKSCGWSAKNSVISWCLGHGKSRIVNPIYPLSSRGRPRYVPWPVSQCALTGGFHLFKTPRIVGQLPDNDLVAICHGYCQFVHVGRSHAHSKGHGLGANRHKPQAKDILCGQWHPSPDSRRSQNNRFFSITRM